MIEHVVADLVANGLQVVLLDNESTDRTVELARKAGADVETFASDGFTLRAQLERFEQIAAERDHDWALVCDADEFRESPWPGMTLIEALREVDALGYSGGQLRGVQLPPDRRRLRARHRRARAPDALRAARGLRRDPDQVLAEPRLARRPVRALRRGRALPEPARVPGAVHPAALPDPRRDARPPQGARRAPAALRRGRARTTAGTCSTTASPTARRRSCGIRPSFAEWDGGAVRAELLARGSHEVLRAQAVRGFEAERTGLDVGALGAWLGRTLGRHGRRLRRGARPRCASPSRCRARSIPGAVPYILAATRLLAGEARLNGRPLWAKELDEAGHATRDRAAHRGRVRRRADRAPGAARRLRPRGLGRRPAHAGDRRRRHRRPAERRRARGPGRRLDRGPARGRHRPAAGGRRLLAPPVRRPAALRRVERRTSCGRWRSAAPPRRLVRRMYSAA